MVELTVGSGADLVNDGGLEIEVDSTGNVLASASLREEGVEGIVATTDGLVRGHLAIRLKKKEGQLTWCKDMEKDIKKRKKKKKKKLGYRPDQCERR